jgi:phosphate transport system permease protein
MNYAQRRDSATSPIFIGVGWLASLVAFGFFVLLIAHLVRGGADALSLEFLFSAPERSGRQGGIGPILVSTLVLLSICLITTVPIGLATAAFLTESMRRYRKMENLTRTSLDILAGMPSIVFGLFGNAFLCKTLGLGFSLLSGGLTLMFMALPLFVRTAEEGLRSTPRELINAAASLGFSRWAMFRSVMLPHAVPSIVVGIVLSVGRAIAETAALIFTSGYVDRMPESWLDSGRSLSVHIFDLSMNVPGGERMAYASSLTLIASVLLINSVAGMLARRFLAGNWRIT